MEKVTVIALTVYEAENGVPGELAGVTILGVYSTEEKAMNAWNDKLEQVGITNLKAYQPVKNPFVPGLIHRLVPLDDYGHVCEADKATMIMELGIKETEIDKTMVFGD